MIVNNTREMGGKEVKNVQKKRRPLVREKRENEHKKQQKKTIWREKNDWGLMIF